MNKRYACANNFNRLFDDINGVQNDNIRSRNVRPNNFGSRLAKSQSTKQLAYDINYVKKLG